MKLATHLRSMRLAAAALALLLFAGCGEDTPEPGDNNPDTPLYAITTQLVTTDDPRFGGTGINRVLEVRTEPSPFHGYPQSIGLNLPPLGALILVPGPS